MYVDYKIVEAEYKKTIEINLGPLDLSLYDIHPYYNVLFHMK